MSTYVAILTKVSKKEYKISLIIESEDKTVAADSHIERAMRKHGFSEQQIIEIRNVTNNVKTIYTESRKIGSKKLIVMNASIS